MGADAGGRLATSMLFGLAGFAWGFGDCAVSVRSRVPSDGPRLVVPRTPPWASSEVGRAAPERGKAVTRLFSFDAGLAASGLRLAALAGCSAAASLACVGALALIDSPAALRPAVRGVSAASGSSSALPAAFASAAFASAVFASAVFASAVFASAVFASAALRSATFSLALSLALPAPAVSLAPLRPPLWPALSLSALRVADERSAATRVFSFVSFVLGAFSLMAIGRRLFTPLILVSLALLALLSLAAALSASGSLRPLTRNNAASRASLTQATMARTGLCQSSGSPTAMR